MVRTIMVALLTVPYLAMGAEESKEPTSSDVVVRKLPQVLPAGDVADEFLWEQFVNKPEERRFRKVQVAKWKEAFDGYSRSLVAKAKKQALDNELLATCLAKIKDDAGKYAFLPVGAYQVRQDKSEIWIVVVKWEYDQDGKVPYELGHVRVYAYDVDAKCIGFTTCL